MNKLYIILILTVIIAGNIFGFMIYNYNKTFDEELLQNQQKIDAIKQQQNLLDKEFVQTQQQKSSEIQTEQTKMLLRDQDGDGLTYQEELQLGTDDNDKDSDGDSINDNIDRHPSGGGETYKIKVNWKHKGLPYTTQFGIHEDKYWFYKDQERGYCCDGWEKFSTPEDYTIKTIAKDITDVSLTTGETCKTCIAIDFVESMVYEYDIDYIERDEYPKYPIETIIDEKGDCEDTSFLMASILQAINIDTIILLFPGHVAVGVWCEGCTGTYYNYKGRNYFFLETTGESGNWKLGRIAEKYRQVNPQILDI